VTESTHEIISSLPREIGLAGLSRCITPHMRMEVKIKRLRIIT
jgi:hypothetical protein